MVNMKQPPRISEIKKGLKRGRPHGIFYNEVCEICGDLIGREDYKVIKGFYHHIACLVGHDESPLFGTDGEHGES